MCLNIDNAKTRCANVVQGTSAPQLCSCLQSLQKEIGTCISRTQLLQMLPNRVVCSSGFADSSRNSQSGEHKKGLGEFTEKWQCLHYLEC